ncbi:hypothetical protein F2P79_006002 [Pimephales promelas]|nr:hypothetical protein F2P79_006002 [Pimephales promelas]
MLSIEGQVVLNQHPNFMAEFAALFATYYNFNLVYQHEASCTLEFVQRCLPRTSMKVERPQRRGTTQSILMCLLFSLGYPVDLEWLNIEQSFTPAFRFIHLRGEESIEHVLSYWNILTSLGTCWNEKCELPSH